MIEIPEMVLCLNIGPKLNWTIENDDENEVTVHGMNRIESNPIPFDLIELIDLN